MPVRFLRATRQAVVSSIAVQKGVATCLAAIPIFLTGMERGGCEATEVYHAMAPCVHITVSPHPIPSRHRYAPDTAISRIGPRSRGSRVTCRPSRRQGVIRGRPVQAAANLASPTFLPYTAISKVSEKNAIKEDRITAARLIQTVHAIFEMARGFGGSNGHSSISISIFWPAAVEPTAFGSIAISGRTAQILERAGRPSPTSRLMASG